MRLMQLLVCSIAHRGHPISEAVTKGLCPVPKVLVGSPPGTYAADVRWLDAQDNARRMIVARWEGDVRTEINVREALQHIGSATFGRNLWRPG